MTIVDSPSQGTKHLVSPDLLAILDLLPNLELTTAEGLAKTREILTTPMPNAPDPDAMFPNTVRTEYRIPGPKGAPEVRIQQYTPKNTTGKTAGYLWFHGGGYIVGRADNDEIYLRRIVEATGVTAFNVSYRLAPESPAPGPVNDAYAALTYVHEHADELGIDRDKIIVGGNSAGGGLAACVSILARDRGEYKIGLQLLLHPMLDDRTASTVEPSPYVGEFVWKPEFNRFAWEALLGTAPGGADTSPYAAPARVKSTAGLPDAYIAVGSIDLFAEEDVEYARRLIHEGVATELHVYPGAFHGFASSPDAWSAQSYLNSMLEAINRFISR